MGLDVYKEIIPTIEIILYLNGKQWERPSEGESQLITLF